MGELDERKMARRHEVGDCLDLGHEGAALRAMLVSMSLCENRAAVKSLEVQIDC